MGFARRAGALGRAASAILPAARGRAAQLREVHAPVLRRVPPSRPSRIRPARGLRRRCRRSPLHVFALVGVLLLAAPAGAEEASGPAGPVSLDKLLQLPDSLEYDVERRGGSSRTEWRARFDEARRSVEEAERALEQAQKALAETAGAKEAWSLAPPGVPVEAASEGGDTFRQREEVRRQREEVERARMRLRELDIEANLAGVPESWRGSSTDSSSGNGSVPAVSAPNRSPRP